MQFTDRVEAGKKLAVALSKYRGNADLILALPRGGVVTAASIARAFDLPLDLVLTRKIGHPHSPEYSIGAVGEGVVVIKSECALIGQNWLEEETDRLKKEITRQRHLFLTNRPSVGLKNKNVIIVDDGIATGHTMEAAIEYVKKHGARSVVVAAPVAEQEILNRLKLLVQEVVVLCTPESFFAVGEHYVSFPEVSDQEVVKILDKHMVNSSV
jgi:predicted phosphoribosyltransferase